MRYQIQTIEEEYKIMLIEVRNGNYSMWSNKCFLYGNLLWFVSICRNFVSSCSPVQLSVAVLIIWTWTPSSRPALQTCATVITAPTPSACATPSQSTPVSVFMQGGSPSNGGLNSSAVSMQILFNMPTKHLMIMFTIYFKETVNHNVYFLR